MLNSILSMAVSIILAISAFISGNITNQTTSDVGKNDRVISFCGSAGLLPESAKDDCP